MSADISPNWAIRMTTSEAPAIDSYFAANDETWPAAQYHHSSRFTCRRGEDAGMRVSAITLGDDWVEDDIKAASEMAKKWGQQPIFSIRSGQTRLDAYLTSKGYSKCFETLVLSAPPALIAKDADKDDLDAFSEILLQIQKDIWQDGGHITEPRLAVMERVKTQKTFLLGRLDNRPVGTGFVAISNGIAMLHALEVHKDAQRRGLGRRLTAKAAAWATQNGAVRFSLLVTTENSAARDLYEALGMEIVSKYHYRVA